MRAVLKGEEGIEACQNYIVSLLVSASQTAQIMLTKTKFAPIEEIAAYKFGIQLIKLLFEDDNVGFYANSISMRYSYIARNYAKLGDVENTLHSLEKCAEYTVILSNLKEMPAIFVLRHLHGMATILFARTKETIKNFV